MKCSPFVLCYFFFLPWMLQSSAEAQQNLDRVVITYPSRSIASIDLYIAQERGFFGKKVFWPKSCKCVAISA
jgi:hypothetical protein